VTPEQSSRVRAEYAQKLFDNADIIATTLGRYRKTGTD
jgi:hypothetical protein